MLTEGDDSSKAVYAIANSDALREEAAALVPVLDDARKPMDRLEFAKIMNDQKGVFGLAAISAEDWRNSLEIYFKSLSDFSAFALADAFRRWNRGEEMKDPAMCAFFPKPAQLHMLAAKSRAEVYSAVYRARKALEHVEKTGVEWTPERKRAEREKMIALGYLNADGSPNLGDLKLRGTPEHERPRQSPHEVAEALRRSDAQARFGGAPISRRHTEAPVEDVGDVV